MSVILKYRGRVVTETDVAFIQELIAAHPTLSRRALSKKLCEAWNWVQPNGALRDMVCRGLMLASHLLGRMARRLSADWEQSYGHPVYFLETFVDPQR